MPVYSTFRDFDLDGSGEINVDELAKAFAKLGTEMSKAPLPPSIDSLTVNTPFDLTAAAICHRRKRCRASWQRRTWTKAEA